MVANPTVIKLLTLIPHNPEEKEMSKPDLSIKLTLPSVIPAPSNEHLTAITHLQQLLCLPIPKIKMNSKFGAFGLNSRLFKAHFHPLKDYETGPVLASTMANI